MNKFYKKLFMVSLLLFFSAFAFAQKKVTGTVTGADDGLPLPGVSVILKGSAKGASTDNQGKFIIDAPADGTLRFSYIGYDAKEVAIAGKSEIIVKLKVAANSLNDVVVIGFQEVSRKKSTAAVSTVKAKDLENLPSPTFDKLLQGRVAGLNVQSFSGEPGGRPTFVVRGNSSIGRAVSAARALSSPLFVIDGIPMANEDISSFGDLTGTNVIAGLNPNDIESIDVLKDAAAASIYGSRGANGVIVVKTKRGKTGKPEINVNAYAGISKHGEMAEYIIGAQERRFKMDYLTKYANHSDEGLFPQILTDSLNPAFNNANDWQGMFFQTGIIQNYDLSASGGVENINYRFSGNYYDEQGIIKGTGFKRYSMAGTMGVKLTDKLKMDAMFRLSRGDRSRARGQAPWENPLPISAGTFPSSLLYISPSDRANFTGELENAKDKNINDDVTASLSLDYDIVKNLHFRTQGALQSSKGGRDIFRPSVLDANNVFYAQSSRANYDNFNIDNLLTYSLKPAENHNLTLLGGNTINYTTNEYTGVGGTGIGNNVITTVKGLEPKNYVLEDPYGNMITGSKTAAAGLLSFFGRASYDFKDRYLFTFSYRADASSRFGKNYRWAYFPAVSAGWVVSDEPFMKSTENWLSSLKFRGSYGVSGNLPGDYYAPFNSYLTGQGGYEGSGQSSTYNGVNAVTINPRSITQDNLTWERSIQSNIGIDAEFFKGRAMVSIDAYNRGTSDIFFDLNLPVTSGYDKVKTNAVDIRNLGVDLNLSGRVFNPESKFQWNPRLVMSFNKSQIVSLPDGNRDIMVTDPNTGTTFILTKGRPVYEFFLVKSEGVYSTKDQIPFDPRTGDLITYWNGSRVAQPGSYRWIDQNYDYDVWDHFDKVRVGNPNPRVTGGFSNSFTFKNFSLEVYTTFVLGREVYNTYISSLLDKYKQLGSFPGTGLLDLNKLPVWRQPGDNAKYADLNPYGPYYYQFNNFSSAYMENGNYLKIKYINLAYNFPAKMLEKFKMKRLQVYTIIDNVYSFQKSSLPDVEAVNELGVYSGDSYPVPRKFTFGIQASF